MRLAWRYQKKQSGLIEVLPLVLLAVFAAFTFVIAATVQKQQQDIRSRAREVEEGVYAPTKKTPTPTPRITAAPPTSRPQPTPYCSKFMKDDCAFGCIETLNGGTCRTPAQGTITPSPRIATTPTATPLASRITVTPTVIPTRAPTPAVPTLRYSVIGGQCRAIYGGGYATLSECNAVLNRQLAVFLTPTPRASPTPTPDTSCLAQCRGTTGSEAVRCLTECRRNEGAISVTTPTRIPAPAATLTLIPTRTPTATITPRPTPTPVCQLSLLGFCLFGGATPTPTRIPTPTSTPRPTGTPRPTVTMTPLPTPTTAPSLAVGDRCSTGFLGLIGNTCRQCPNGAYIVNPVQRTTTCGIAATGSSVAISVTPAPGITRVPTAPPPRFGSGATPQPSVTPTSAPSPTRTPTAPPPRFGSGGTPLPSITVTQSPTPTLSPGANCVTGIFGWGDTCSRCPYGYAASTSRRGLFCNPAPGVTINEGVTPSPATPPPTYNACSAQEFAGYTATECTRRGGRPRAIGGSTVCCTLPGRTPTPPPGAAPAGSLALGATCNVSSECRSGFCDWHMVNGVASGKECSPAPRVTPTPTFAVLPSVTPTPTPLPIEAGSCSGGVPINGCARAQNNRWVRCSPGRGQGNSSGRYTYPYYVEDASCARVDLALVGGGTLTVQLESDTASTDLTADRIQCLNVATFGGSCDNVAFGTCSSDKKYVCDCTYYRYPTFRAATGSEQGTCSTERPLFTTRSVADAVAEQTVLQQARQASCARGCTVGGSIYGAGYCASAVSQCQCNESTGWQPRLVTVTQDDCRAGGTTTQEIGSAFNTSSGYFCGDDGNVYQNRQSPQLVSFCRNSGLICGQRSTGQIECRGASTLDELASAGLGGSPDTYECVGTNAYRIKSRPSETTRCPSGTTCQTSEGAVQCAPTDQSWQQFLTSYQTSAQAASRCSGGGNYGDSRGSGSSAETCMCDVRDNAIVTGSCSWRASAQVATQVLEQSSYPQSYITAFQNYQREHPGATLTDFQQAQVAAFDRIRPTLVNLGVLDQAYMDRITSGEYVPTELERTLAQQRQNLGARILLGLNNLTSGATLRGNNLLLQGEETWRSGDYINGANQIVRGALIQGAAPATLAVAIAALPALPLAGAISGGLIIPSALTGVLTFGGTAVGIAGTTYSLQHTAEACAPGTLATRECAFAAGNTAFAALSTGVGVAAGSLQLAAQANMARSGLALAQGAGAASDAMTGATIANATGRAATIASWNKAVALGGTVLFGSQAIEACTQGVPDDPNNPDGPRHIDTLNCAVNTAMALTSAARFVGASAGLNPASLPNKSVEVLDVGTNSVQAVIACAGGAAQRDLTGCAQAISGAALSAGGAYAATSHAGNLADTPTARFEEAQQTLVDLYLDPNAPPREAQLRPGITPEQVTTAETALRQAILVRAQERAAVDLALRPLGGSEQDWTASQRTLRTAQQDYQAALAAYERLADQPLAERLASPQYRTYQESLDRLVTTKATVNVEGTALRSPRNPLQQLGDRVVKLPEVDAFQRAQDDFRRVATTTDPQSLEYRQALDRLMATQQSVRELTYNRTQNEITAELRPRQEELRNLQGDLTTLREENALLADPAKAQQALRDAQVALEEARTRRAGVSGEEAVNADLVIRQIEQKLARAQELSGLATDYANGVPDAVRQVTDRQLREQTVGRQVSVLSAQAARLEGARVRAGTVQGWLADRLLGTPKNPTALAEVFLGRTSPEVQLVRQLVADQVGRAQAEQLVAQARSRVEQNAGLSLTDALTQVFAEKGQAGVRQEVLAAAASALRQSGITDEALIARRAGLIADSVTDTLWSGRDRLAATVVSGLDPAQGLDFRLRPTGLAAVGAAITGAGGAVGRSAAGAVIGVSDSLSDLGSNLRVRREAEPATLTSEARNLVGRLAQLQTERGVTALDSATSGTSRNALLSAGSEQVTMPDGKTVARTRFELTDAGRTAGFTEGDIRLLNQVTRAFEDFQASQNPNFERIRAGTGDFRDQARFVVSALETFGAKGSRGAVFGALPGMGKTDVVMPLNILLQARMTADPQFVVFPDGPLMEQFLRNDGAGNRAMVRFYEQNLGPDSVLVVRQGDPPPTPEQIAAAKVIVTTRDVAFTLRETDTPTGAAMRERWRNSYIQGDEAHWTLNPFESYQITAGEQRRVLQTSEGTGFVQAKDEVTRLTAVRELIEARIQGRQPQGVTKSPDGRSGVYTPETELRILREWLATRDSAGVLPAELKPLVNSTDLPTIARELNRFLDTNPTQAAGPLGRELTLINKLADVLAAVPGNDYGPSARGNEVILAPREQGKITGRQYQSIPEQLLYNTVGAEITGSRVDLNTLTVSTQSRDINYALLMFEAKGFALYTGTPELVARMYEQAYGVNLRTFSDSAFDTVSARLTAGQQAGTSRVFTNLADSARSGDTSRNPVYVNMDTSRANSIVTAEIASLHPDQRLFVVGGNGEFIEYTTDTSGRLTQVQTYPNREALNVRTSALDNAGGRYVKIYEYGAHTGVDTFNDVSRSRGVIIAGSDINQTTFAQGVNRLRPDASGTYPPIDIVYLGDTQTARTPTELMTDLNTRLAANEVRSQALGEIQFKETLLRNSVDIMFDRLISRAGETRLLGLVRPDGDMVTRLQSLQDSWKRTSELAYRLGSGEVEAQTRLQRTLEQVQALYRQVGSVVADNPNVAREFNRQAQGFDSATINFVATQTQETSFRVGQPPTLRDIVRLINSTTSTERFAGVTFTERGAGPQVITADAAAAARAVNIISDIDTPVGGPPAAGGGGPRAEVVTPQARQQQLAAQVRQQEFARLETRFPILAYQPIALEALAAGLPTDQVRVRVVEALNRGYTSDITQANFDAWVAQFAAGLVGRAILPKVGEDLASGNPIATSDLLLARLGSQDLSTQNQVSVPRALLIPIGGQFRVVDNNVQTRSVTLVPETKIEFGVTRLTTTVYSAPLIVGQDQKIDLSALPTDANLVRLTTKDGTQYTVTKDDFLVQTQQQAVTAAVTQQVTTVLTTQPLVPQIFGLRRTGFAASDLQTPKGQVVVAAVINLQTALAIGTYKNSADVLGAIDYQSLIRALFDLSQTVGRYRGVSATALADAAIVAAGGSQNLLTGKQQPGRIGGAPVSTFFVRVGEATRALFGRLGQAFAGIRLPGGGSQALNALGNWFGQRLTDLGNFFVQVTQGLPTFFRRTGGEAVRDLFLWKPLSGLMTSPRVPQRTKNILAGSRDGVAEVVFNAVPFGIGRSNWNLRNAAIDTAAYFFTRNLPYAGVVLSIYDGARIARWVTEKVSGVPSSLRIKPPAPQEAPQGVEEAPVAEVTNQTPVKFNQPAGWEGIVIGHDADGRYYRIQVTKGRTESDKGGVLIRARSEFELFTPPAAAPAAPVAPAPVVVPPVKLPSGPLVTPQRFDLPQTQMMIGRSDQAQIRLPLALDTQVSRQHARIAFTSGGFNLIDLGSLHGTFILRGNQEIKVPTDKPMTLVKGDIILLARNGTYFRFLGNALDGPHFDGKQALVQLLPLAGRVDKVLAAKLFSDKPMLEALRDRIEGLIFDLDFKSAQIVINDELRSVLEDEGLRGSDLETAKNQLAVRLNVADIIDDLKARIAARSRASDMTVPLISRPRYDRVGRLPANLRPVQQYKYEYVSSGGQKLRIDLINDPELRGMVDRAIREIAEIRDKSRSFLGGPPSKSRLDALAEWVNREVNYNKNIQQKIYAAGGGQAGLGQIVCNGGVCREKSFLVDLLARELGIQSEVWVFDFGDGGRHAINYFPQRQLIVDATNETQALTVAEYENRSWVRRIGGINWSSVLRFGHQDAISEEENALPRGGGRRLYSNPILQVTTGVIRAPLELLGNAVDPQAQTFIGRLAKAAVGVDDYATGRDTLEAQRYQETVVSPWNNFWQSQFGATVTSNNPLGLPLRQLLTLIAPNVMPPAGPVAPQEVSRGSPPPPAGGPPVAASGVTIIKPLQEVLSTLSLNISRLQALPNAQTITAFVTRRLIDPGFQKILPVASLPQDLVIYENDAVASRPRYQEILANYQNNRPGLPIFSSFVLKRLVAAGYQAINLDIRNLASANEVGGSPNGIVGDYLIYDTIAAIQKELGEDYLLVRTGGDEFTVLSRQPFTGEVTARIQTAAGNTSGLFTQSGRVVYKPAQVKVTVTSPADLAEADARPLPAEELSLGLRLNRLNAYHPELRLITDALVTLPDQAELGNLLAFFEEALFDPVLQKEAQQLAVNGKNVEVYVNRTDYINHLQARSGALRLVRIDLPGVLKRINDNHNYTVGNAFLTYEFQKIVEAVAKYQNNVIIFRRGGDFYVALPDNQDLVNTVSGEIESAIRGETGSFPAEEERITLIPALASVRLNLELVKEPTPEVSSINERAFAVAQEQLAQEVWRATIMQLQRFYSVEHRSPDWEFLLRYLDPYDRRGNNRLVRMATPFIADLQKLYYDPALEGRSGVREGQVEVAKGQLLQILNGYQYPQPPLDVTETQTKLQAFERRVPAPLRLVRVGSDYVVNASNQVRDGLIQTRRAIDRALLPEVFQGKELYQVLAENNTEFEVVPFAVQSMEEVRDTMFRNLRELGFPTEAAMVEKVYSWHAEAIREVETRRGRAEYPGFTDELARTIERANRNNYNHMMTVVLRSLEVAAAGRLTRAETSVLLKAVLWHDISKPWMPDGRRGSAALAAAAAKDAQTPGAVPLGMRLGDLLTHPQESSQMVRDNWQDFGLASPEEAMRVARIIGAHWGRDPFYVGVLKGQIDSPEQLPAGDRLLAAMLDTADNSANTGPFEALKIVSDELVQGGFRQPVKTIAQALKGYLKSVIGYYDSHYLPEYGRVIIGNNIREIARMINWIEADPQQLSFMLETYGLAAGRPEQNRETAGLAAGTFAVILKSYDEVRHDPHFDLLDIDVTPEGEIKRVTDPVAHLVARYEAAFKEPFFTADELASRPQVLAAYAAENLALGGLNQEKSAHTFVVQLWERLFRRRGGVTSVSPRGPQPKTPPNTSQLPTSSNKSTIMVNGQPVELLVLGQKSPLEIDPTNPGDNVALYHGAGKPLRVNLNYTFAEDSDQPDGSITLGTGLYTTDDKEQAQKYSDLRGKITGSGFVSAVIPYQAKMLDLRGHRPVPEPLFQAWADHWLAHFGEIESKYQAKTKKTMLDELIYEEGLKYSSFLKSIRQITDDSSKREIRYVLGTMNIPEYRISQGLGPIQNTVFRDFMLSLGVDGLIAQEGGDSREFGSANSFVFYNYATVGTIEDWRERHLQ